MWAGDHWFEFFGSVMFFAEEFSIAVIFEHCVFFTTGVATGEIFFDFFVGGDDSVLATGFNGHVAEGHPLFHAAILDGLSGELHGSIGGAVYADVSDYLEDHIFGHYTLVELAVEDESHCGRYAQPELAGTHDECGLGVADSGGELSHSAVSAGVGVGAEQDLTGYGVALLG